MQKSSIIRIKVTSKSGVFGSGIVHTICDMIKRNESDVSHIVFEIMAKTVFKFLCFILFLAVTNSS